MHDEYDVREEISTVIRKSFPMIYGGDVKNLHITSNSFGGFDNVSFSFDQDFYNVLEKIRYNNINITDKDEILKKNNLISSVEPNNSFPIIRRIIFNGDHTIIKWKDNSTTVVTREINTADDRYAAFCQAFIKKLFETSTNAQKYYKFYQLPEYIQDKYDVTEISNKLVDRLYEDYQSKRKKSIVKKISSKLKKAQIKDNSNGSDE